jgi:transcriptional regulator with XRE-family HTH domain
MQSNSSLDPLALQPSEQLSVNVMAALRVAGIDREGKSCRLQATEVMRRSRISRSTLRPLMGKASPGKREPDLATLRKLAAVVGIPLPFLLMRPADWQTMAGALNALGDCTIVADRVVKDGMNGPERAHAVLAEMKRLSDNPPHHATPDPVESERLKTRNEWRARASLVMAALAQPAARGDRQRLVILTALACALTLNMTPSEPSPIDGSEETPGA